MSICPWIIQNTYLNENNVDLSGIFVITTCILSLKWYISKLSAIEDLSQYPLCQRLEISPETRQQRLQLMELTRHDVPLIEQLHTEIIRPCSTVIIDRFYEFLFALPQMRAHLDNETQVHKLKTTQAEYLLSFGIDFDSLRYFEYRLRVGMAHYRIGLSLLLYITAYRKLQQLILEHITESKAAQAYRLAEVTIKISALDMSLATDTYCGINIANLTDSVQSLENERDSLYEQVIHDPLTGALSRRYLLDILAKQISALKRNHHDLCIAMLDIDFFKAINDKYGHICGDHLLQKMVRMIQAGIRDNDYLVRYGGEEFLLVFTHTDVNTAFQIAERIRNNIADSVFDFEGNDIHASISIGITSALTSDDVQSLLERADKALYTAKNAGRNRTIQI